jgi:ABC-2 type transport system ATP-binding protein
LERALRHAGIAVTPTADGALLAQAAVAEVGAATAAANIALLELRVADGGRLEELFLSLTRGAAAASASESASASASAACVQEVAR